MRKGFVAYSKADSSNVDRLMVHLKGLEYEGLIETWYDRYTTPGEEWDAKIRAELVAADIIIFCVSADLLATDYVQRIEIPKAIARRDRGEATVIPVIIGKCAWEDSALGKLQGIPGKGNTVQDYVRDGRPDDVWTEVTSAVRDAVRSYHKIPDHNRSISLEIGRIRREWLDVSPLERAKIYLNDPGAWIQNSTGINLQVYYEIFPEFTLIVTDAEDYIACNQEWTRGEVCVDNNYAAYYEIYYHQTCLARIHYVGFDDNKKSMVAPEWRPCGAGRFYFYEADSISYAVQKYHSAPDRKDHSEMLSIAGYGEISNQARSWWGRYMKIPVLRTGELNEFLGLHRDIEQSQDETEQYELFLRNQLEFEKWRNARLLELNADRAAEEARAGAANRAKLTPGDSGPRPQRRTARSRSRPVAEPRGLWEDNPPNEPGSGAGVDEQGNADGQED